MSILERRTQNAVGPGFPPTLVPLRGRANRKMSSRAVVVRNVYLASQHPTQLYDVLCADGKVISIRNNGQPQEHISGARELDAEGRGILLPSVFSWTNAKNSSQVTLRKPFGLPPSQNHVLSRKQMICMLAVVD
ncbi:hypothetical protein OE88DRAFT_1653755 [Heliocybe sulcata]|uniref:Uncharacterized protein n=1 Tax=Heliocybe sulcata TaxID=5364 RepID=A0A5C3NF46_9AGAM|nr:hypothetical protein OE88DRAFT_1653755 [Heliocybe sulcata]